MSTLRAIAREAVIFMLLGPVVTALAVFAFVERRSIEDVKADAARAVYAFNVTSLPNGYRLDNSVLVPLTNGVQLYVTDCDQAHPSVVVSEPPSESVPKTVPIPPGATNGSDCVYFSPDEKEKQLRQLGGRLVSVPLGDQNQVAIEKDYWQAYAKSKHEHFTQNALGSLVLSLWGFPAGIIVWLFYRLVRFAVKG